VNASIVQLCEDDGSVSSGLQIESLSDGLIVSLQESEETKKSSQIIYSCNTSWENHLQFTGISKNDEVLTIHADSARVCSRYIPSAIPNDPEFCYFANLSNNGAYIQFNASTCNRDKGYEWEVMVTAPQAPYDRIL
jgi:hypothetical protein